MLVETLHQSEAIFIFFLVFLIIGLINVTNVLKLLIFVQPIMKKVLIYNDIKQRTFEENY